MKSQIFLMLSMTLLVASIQSEGQALITKKDSVSLAQDTIVKIVLSEYRGNIQWQQSADGMKWTNMAESTADTLKVKPDREAMFRAVITEGTCLPVFSDTVHIIFYKPAVTTDSVTDITPITGICWGNVTGDGGAVVTARGICRNRTGRPTTDDTCTNTGSGTGSFSGNLSGLTAATTYYVRAYAINDKGIAYGNEITFKTLVNPEPDSVTDVEGNVYTTIKIGTQTWMRQNLRVTKAPDGIPITSYVYDNNTENAKTYGRLYTWDVAMNGSTKEMAQGICPSGWHIPSDGEWKTLEMYLGMTKQEADISNDWRGSGVGTKLRQGGTSGYDALYSGRYSGDYYLLNQFEYIWTSTESGQNAWRRCLYSQLSTVGRYNTFPKSYGFSVRCVKNN